MSSLKKSFYIFFLISLLAGTLFAQSDYKGTALCDDMFSFLQKNDVHPQVQPLTASGYNSLPYNIIVSFSPEDIKSEHNLIILFDTNEAWNNKDILLPIINELRTKSFNSSVVFCYESTINLPRQNIIYGSDVFARSLNTNQENAVLLFNLSAKKNAIISGSNGRHSPSWMLKDMFDAFSDAKITEGLPLCFISQVADFTFSTDRRFLSFLEAEIPCISADIRVSDKAEQVIINCINLYDSSRFEQDDSHAFMFRLFGKRIWLSEYRIVSSLIIIIVLGFVLVFITGFVNRTLRKEFWHEIRSNWYVIPVIYILSVLGFFAGKGLYKLFVSPANTSYTVFGCIILQISIATLLVSVFYMLNLSLLKKYTTRSLDFILVIDTFINQLIFTLLDVSLFPIFLMIFIVSVISLIFRRNWIHIILFVFLIVPFLPYINALFTISDSEKLHNMLVKSNTLPLLLSFILLPVYLMWLRILNAIKKRYPKKRVYALVMSGAYVFIFIAALILNRTIYSNKKSPTRELKVIPLEQSSEIYDFSISYSDKTVFSDIIRKINVSAATAPVYSALKIISSDGLQPVLYSENDFVSEQADTVVFSVPLYPPQQLEFNYGCTPAAQTILVEQIYYSSEDNCYYEVSKTIEINEQAGGKIE